MPTKHERAAARSIAELESTRGIPLLPIGLSAQQRADSLEHRPKPEWEYTPIDAQTGMLTPTLMESTQGIPIDQMTGALLPIGTPAPRSSDPHSSGMFAVSGHTHTPPLLSGAEAQRLSVPTPPLVRHGLPVKTQQHPVGEVFFSAMVTVPAVELMQDRDDFSDEDIVRKYAPDLLEQLLGAVERWRTSNEIDPVTDEEARS